MQHEAAHGVFFADGEYRALVFDVWANLSDVERKFWRLFLARRSYDDSDEFLMVNEFQAYLMQQNLSEVDEYFLGFAVPRLKITSPDDRAFLDEFSQYYSGTFSRSARMIAEESYRSSGFSPEGLFCLERS